ncbi:RagB/SusD family nutrient uptake outer membrane protein [Chitinophaga tropicalis]|uniref:RagB/SusD family nutrient uptake outer membrane protein n=1 Tax=Chitinophaga tropicalis TaxID=2683588 RepID=A0A7K1U5L7_9BACT|nr:RagB/SusD family nutrient uptake outer membrane protein [Chitinophaga tropicalis]MVT09662.1 RagB/SusD family nutrient uptake outer membrane protein [Chitinophaga tropicalis]
MKHLQYIAKFTSILLFFAMIQSCYKLVEVDPPINAVVSNEIFGDNLSASSVVTGIYTDMSQGIFAGRNSLTTIFSVSADELTSVAKPDDFLSIAFTNSLTTSDGGIWPNLFDFIFRINAAIEGIQGSKSLSSRTASQLLGECKFLRAYMYFYLVNTYGDVPLLTSTDLKYNFTAPRVDKKLVFENIISDLKESQLLLDESYLTANLLNTTSDRVRPNKACATALLARTYLYMKNYAEAITAASMVIENPLYKIEGLDSVFLRESKEAIWQLQPVQASSNTLEAQVFVLYSNDGLPAGPNDEVRPLYISKSLYNSFPDEDKRKTKWIDSVTVDNRVYPFPYKYKIWMLGEPVIEYLTMLRLAELYLIRAEAKANLGILEGGASAGYDINVIRRRAGLPDFLSTNRGDVIEEVLTQRRLELFTEFGHRWFDLKRTERIDDVMGTAAVEKGGTWAPYKSLFPIPISDITRNPSLRGHQNPGYPIQ